MLVKDAVWSVPQGFQIDCSAGIDLGRAFTEYVGELLDLVFHQHAGSRVTQGCCIALLTGCWIECFIGMLD